VWRTLDPKRSDEFRQKLVAAAEQGRIRHKTANMLAIAYSELAYHKQRTRGEGLRTTCYEMMPLGVTLMTTRENALKQIELLAKARQAGAIDAETAAKAHAVLAREVQMLGHTKGIDWGDHAALEQLRKRYEEGKIIASDSASVASAIIVEMEEGQVPDLTPAKRLSVMKERVQKLLKTGPGANDWMDPGIRPNLLIVLAKAGLIDKEDVPGIKCYKRYALPVQARSDELKKLQAELLDRNVKAGVLDVEVAKKATAAAVQEPKVDYATEEDIRHYQEKLRRAIRLLYKRGELPSSFVRELEEAADIDIIRFVPAKMLRNDMRYHVRSAFWGPEGGEVLKLLEKRKLVPKQRNWRLVMKQFGDAAKITEETKKKLAEFERLIDGEEKIELQGDERVNTKNWWFPQKDTAYRLKMRRVCRALVKTGLVREETRLRTLGESIGIGIWGTIE
jgi:hypothetical protein